MEGRAYKAGLRRLAAAILLAASFATGYTVGAAGEDIPLGVPHVSEQYVPSGRALWQNLPAPLLMNVAGGLMERISELQYDLDYVQELRKQKMAYLHE